MVFVKNHKLWLLTAISQSKQTLRNMQLKIDELSKQKQHGSQISNAIGFQHY